MTVIGKHQTETCGQRLLRFGRRWRRALNILVLISGAVACAWVLEGIRRKGMLPISYDAVGMTAILAVNVVAVACVFFFWRSLVGYATGVKVSIARGLVGQASLMVGKYVPGKVVGLFGRLLSLDGKTTAAQGGSLVAVEQAYLVAGLGIVGTGVVGLATPSFAMLALCLGLTMLALFSPSILGRWAGKIEILAPAARQVVQVAQSIGPRRASVLVFLASSASLGVCATVWFAPDLLGFDASFSLRWHLVGIYALSIVAGMAVIFLPGGIGAREGAFFLLSQPLIGPEAAIACAAFLRLVNVLIDLGMGCVAISISRWMVDS